MFKMDGKVYTQILKNYSTSELIPILQKFLNLLILLTVFLRLW